MVYPTTYTQETQELYDELKKAGYLTEAPDYKILTMLQSLGVGTCIGTKYDNRCENPASLCSACIKEMENKFDEDLNKLEDKISKRDDEVLKLRHETMALRIQIQQVLRILNGV